MGQGKGGGGHAPPAQASPSQGDMPEFDDFGCYRIPSWFDRGAWSIAEWQVYWGIPPATVERARAHYEAQAKANAKAKAKAADPGRPGKAAPPRWTPKSSPRASPRASPSGARAHR